MNKISVIIAREYSTRVRKKSFIIMTFLTPVLIAGIFAVQFFMMSNKDKDFKKIAVVEDGSDLFKGVIPNTDDAEFVYVAKDEGDELKKSFESKGYFGVLYIYPQVIEAPNAIKLYSKKQPAMGLLDHISGALEKEIERQKLLAYNIQDLDQIMKSVDTKIDIQTIRIDETGKTKETRTEVAMILAYICGFLMYMLVFIFGSQVMRGVIEEKTSRIVEVIVSSVKPVQLMVGKIIGIGLVGLTQFAVWVMLTVGIIYTIQSTTSSKVNTEQTQNMPQSLIAQTDQVPDAAAAMATQVSDADKMWNAAMDQNWGLIIPVFLFFFITGYFLYASLFAAVGSAVDNETETQQFMLPITIPIILGLVVAMGTMQNPESSLSFWFSIIPFTSPIVMVARIPFDVPGWEIALSMGLMAVTFIGCVFMAAKIYRTGILMYGKKTSYSEIWKWLRYKE